jgi:hypothetical protein
MEPMFRGSTDNSKPLDTILSHTNSSRGLSSYCNANCNIILPRTGRRSKRFSPLRLPIKILHSFLFSPTRVVDSINLTMFGEERESCCPHYTVLYSFVSLPFSFARSPSLFYLLVHSRCRGFLFSLDHIQTHTTLGRTPLDEGSARRRDFYLTTQTL